MGSCYGGRWSHKHGLPACCRLAGRNAVRCQVLVGEGCHLLARVEHADAHQLAEQVRVAHVCSAGVAGRSGAVLAHCGVGTSGGATATTTTTITITTLGVGGAGTGGGVAGEAQKVALPRASFGQAVADGPAGGGLD